MTSANKPTQISLPFDGYSFHIPVIKLPQPDGSLLLKAGRPQAIGLEVSTKEFHKATGISIRHIETLCEQGLLKHRRLSEKPRSHLRILRSELERYKQLGCDTSPV